MPDRRPLSRQAKRWLKRRGIVRPADSGKKRLRWQDAVGLLSIPLAIAGLRAEDTVFVTVCFVLSASVASFSIATNDQLKTWFRAILVLVIISVFCGLTVYIRNENISKGLASNEGILEPGNKERPTIASSICSQQVPKDAFAFIFGSNVDWAINAPHNAIRIGNDLLSVTVLKDGNARIDRLSIFVTTHPCPLR
jgi:hypothetical protein